ncbi:TPM domain-containing protein [Larkinella soli]|uniref:TPM domain-containing protein n=1 Tax=Larkinella soli TaxID=1770527 RepID=UPI000FFBE262|nr:TPM domain-containing protein [Larkinella soli]
MNLRFVLFRFAPPVRVLAALLLVLTSLWAFGQDQGIPDRPNPPRLVNDYTGILSAGEREQLEQKLRRYNDSTSTQIVVLIVRTTDPYPIGDFSFQVGRKWGVGQEGKNNGLVLTWATDTRKVFIATGYGLEGAIPDAIAKRIVSQIIIPRFKNQEWYAGLDEATTEIIRRASGEYQAEGSEEDGGSGLGFILIIFLGILLLIWIGRNRGGGNRNRNRGGGFFPLPFPPTTFSGWGGSSGNWGGGGGGGGFGGFGGGSFGGGGAGGDY